MLTDKNIDLRVIKNIHSKKSSIVRQLIIQLNKSKPTLFGLLLKINFAFKYSKNFEKGPGKCSQLNPILVKLQMFGFATDVPMGYLVRKPTKTKCNGIFF